MWKAIDRYDKRSLSYFFNFSSYWKSGMLLLCIWIFPFLNAGAQAILSVDDIPSSFAGSISSEPVDGSLSQWWTVFSDPNLNQLEELAMKNNYNVRSSLKKIQAARELLKGVYSAYSPVVGLSAGYDFERDSGRESTPYATNSNTSYFQMGATVSWEIDLFGRISAKAKTQKSNIKISRLDYDALLLSISAEVAINYGALCMYHQQLKVAKSHLKSQQELLEMVKSKFDAGLISRLDVAQAENSVNMTRLRIPTLENGVEMSKLAIATLCGVKSEKISSLLFAEYQPALSIPEAIGQPADLLRNRPDIALAEEQIHNIASQMGVAKKDYLPSLSINGEIATHSHDAAGLFGKSSMTFSLVPQLTWTLFDGLSRKFNITGLKAEMEAQIDNYNNTVLTAIQEVDGAILKYDTSRKELALYDDVLENSRQMLILSIERYKLGLVNFSDVANAQITYLTYQTNLLTTRNNCYNSLVALYKSLGGGWKPSEK